MPDFYLPGAEYQFFGNGDETRFTDLKAWLDAGNDLKTLKDHLTSGTAHSGTFASLSLVDAAGDLLVGSGPDALERLAKGARSASLFVDTDQTGDLRWIVERVNVQAYGALGDNATNDTAAIQAAIAAVPSTGGIVYFPPGIYRYTALTVASTQSNVIFYGPGSTLRKTGTTGDGIAVSGASFASMLIGFRLVGLTLDCSAAQASGTLIRLTNCRHVLIHDVRIQKLGTFTPNDAITLDKYVNIKVSDSTILDHTGIGIHARASGQVLGGVDLYVSNCLISAGSGNTSGVGMYLNSGISGVYVQNVDVVFGGVCVKITDDAPADGKPEYLWFHTVLADTMDSDGWQLNAGKGITLVDCWGSTSTTGSGLKTAGALSVRLHGGTFLNNNRHGIHLTSAADDCLVDGALCSGNSKAGANTYDGIHVAANLSGFILRGNRCGNISGLGGGTQGYGIQVAAGTSNVYHIVGNYLGNNGTGGLFDGGTGTTKLKTRNLGVNPDGAASITVTASPFAYINNDGVPEAIYIRGGTVSDISKDSTTIFTSTEQTVWLEPGEAVVVTYSVAPTMVKDRK